MISLRKLLPICAMPNGGFTRSDDVTFLKLTKIPCAVSGRRYAMLAASRIAPTCVSNIRLKSRGSVRSHSLYSPGCFDGRLPHGALREVVGAEAQLAGAAVDHRVGEAADMARGDPDLRMQDHGRVERDHVVALLDHRALPGALDVLREQDAVVAEVERRAEAAVDVGRREDESAPACRGTRPSRSSLRPRTARVARSPSWLRNLAITAWRRPP